MNKNTATNDYAWGDNYSFAYELGQKSPAPKQAKPAAPKARAKKPKPHTVS